MRRPSRVTKILWITGTPPLAFTVALFVLGSIPENIAPYLTVALVVAPSSVFLPVFAYALFKHSVMTGRQRMNKLVPMSCVICGEALPKAAIREVGKVQGPHYERIHPDFWRWVNGPRRKMLLAVISAILVIGAVTLYEVAISNYLRFIAGIALLVVLVIAGDWFQKRKLASFKRQWQRNTRPGINGLSHTGLFHRSIRLLAC